jgi:hypothetical protein
MKKSYLWTGLTMALLSMTEHEDFRTRLPVSTRPPDTKPKKKTIPKGCKEYHFDEDGFVVTEQSSTIVYSCVATSKRIAIEKFNKFKNN